MENSESGSSSGPISDLLRKIVNTSIGFGLNLSEENIKNLPKELVQQLMNNARNTKDDMFNALAKGVTDYLQKVDVTKEINKIIDNYEMDFQVRLSFKKREKKEQQVVHDEVVQSELDNDNSKPQE